MINEVSPPGWGHTKAEKEKTKPEKPKSKIGGTAHAMKLAQKRGDIPKNMNIFALMWSMKNKGDKPHYKPGVKDKLKGKYKGPEGQNEMIDPKKIRNYKNVSNAVVAKADKEAEKVKDKEQKGTLEFPQMPTEESTEPDEMIQKVVEYIKTNGKRRKTAGGDGRRKGNHKDVEEATAGELELANAKKSDKKQQGGSLKHKVWPASASMKMPKEEVGIDEGPPTPKFKPLKHKVYSADASIPAGARPKNPGKIKKYKASGAMPEEVEFVDKILALDYKELGFETQDDLIEYAGLYYDEVDEVLGAIARGAMKGAAAAGKVAGKLAVKGAKAAAPHVKRGAIAGGKLAVKGAAVAGKTAGKLAVKGAVVGGKAAGKLAVKGAKAGGKAAGKLAVKGAKAAAPHVKRGAIAGGKLAVKGAKKVGKETKRVSKEVGKEIVSRASAPREKKEDYVSDFGNKLRQAIEEAKKVNAIDTINKIVKTKTMGKLHGQKVDLFTASAIQQVYNALNKKNQEKMISVMSKDVHGLLKMADFSMKQMKR